LAARVDPYEWIAAAAPAAIAINTLAKTATWYPVEVEVTSMTASDHIPVSTNTAKAGHAKRPNARATRGKASR
jgi:hypothetical protein